MKYLAHTILLLFLAVVSGSSTALAADFKLDRPIDCLAGKTCWIVNYVDLNPAPKARQDYRCGWRTYDTHKGVDFAIRDLAVMEAGVPVLASAPGVVKGIRDGMKDISFRKLKDPNYIAKKECGNGVMLVHEDGWSTQYCHMKQGSLVVKKGQKVARGQKLGLVGLSGRTEFPHVHITLRQGKKVIDPFVGMVEDGKCGKNVVPLWNEPAIKDFAYGPALYNAGFSAVKPKADAARAGLYQDAVLPREAPVLVFWSDIFGTEKGDRLKITIAGPDGKQFFEHGVKVARNRARWMVFAGQKRKKLFWDEGSYVGTLTLVRKGGTPDEATYSISRTVELR